MLKRKALRKILITTFAVFTLFVVYFITDMNKLEELKISPDIEYMASLGMDDVYLLGNNNYLVKTNTLLDAKDTEGKMKILLDYMTIRKNNKLPVGLSGLLPSETKVYGISIEGDIATVNVSKELWSGSSELEERIIEGLTYSITSLEGVRGLRLQVEGITVTELPKTKKPVPEVLTKEYGINKVYDLDQTTGIKKVTTYYLNQINDQKYYVPVTKYVNDSREKIDIIVENLSSNFLYESSLISLLQGDVELMNYQVEDELMLLNFNHNLFDDEKLLEEVTYQVAYSIFDSYDVQVVLFEVEGKELTRIER
ncbi:MAG: hypothetical protein HFG40_00165 [Bacilli bacterium]|nr:hypothetical protein [Bacilli bacterium]